MNTKEECINGGYKIFNRECIKNCPINTQFDDNDNCICKYNYYNESNLFTCYGNGETCEISGYPINIF